MTYTQPSLQALALATAQAVWGPVAIGNYTTLAVEGDGVFALGGFGKLSAFDAATGVKRWEIQLEGQTLFESPPVAKGGLVYANGTGIGGMTYAIDERTGATVWTANFGEASSGTVAGQSTGRAAPRAVRQPPPRRRMDVKECEAPQARQRR